MLPLPGVALDVDLAAEQARDLAADREAQAGAAVLAAGRAVGLLERLEDQLLLVARRCRCRCRRPRRRRRRRSRSASFAKRVAGVGRLHAQRRPSPRSVNLKALESRFFRTCCSRCGSVRMRRGQLGVDLDRRTRGPSAPRPAGTLRSTKSATSASATSRGSTCILPASTLDRSRISLISVSRSPPDA